MQTVSNKAQSVVRWFKIESCYLTCILFQFCILTSICNESISWAQVSEHERIYLRYQGQIEGGRDLASTIDCLFEFLDSSDLTLYRERNPNVLVIDESFTVTLGAGENPLEASFFQDSVKLLVQCDLDRDGSYDVVSREQVGTTPKAAVALSVRGPVEADYLKVNGAEVVSPDGEWLGAVVTDQALNAGSLEVTEATISSRMTSASAQIDDLTISNLQHQASPEGPTRPLIDANGVWVGPILLPDQDQDQVSDWIEHLLGTDPLDPSSLPLDENEDGIFDVFQVQQNNGNEENPNPVNPLPFDTESLTHLLSYQQTAVDYLPEVNPNEAWLAGSIDIQKTGELSTLSIELSATQPSGTHFITATLIAPNGDRFTLLNADPLNPPVDLLTEWTARFSADTPPDGLDWSTVLYAEETARSIQGLWQIELTNSATDGSTITLNRFHIEAVYNSTTELSFTRDLNLQDQIRLTAIPSPVNDSDAVNKQYVDQSLSTGIAEAINAHLEAQHLDPTRPNGMAYHYRIFDVYDAGSASYLFPNHPELFAGQNSSDWGNGSVRASALDLNLLNDFLNQEHLAQRNTLIVNQSFKVNDAEALFAVIRTQIENHTEEPITWSINPLFSCDNALIDRHQVTSLALNGIDRFTSTDLNCSSTSNTALINLEFPANQVSDLVFVVAASTINQFNERRLIFAFANNEISSLPEGLSFRKTW